MQAQREKKRAAPDKPPVDRADLYPITLTTKRLQSVVHALLETEFLRHGVTLAQWDVLCSVHEHPGASGAAIARECLVTPQTVSLVLPKLEQMELVERRKAERGKVIETHITEKGVVALDRCNRHIAEMEQRLTAAVGPGQSGALIEALRTCVISIAGRPDPKL